MRSKPVPSAKQLYELAATAAQAGAAYRAAKHTADAPRSHVARLRGAFRTAWSAWARAASPAAVAAALQAAQAAGRVEGRAEVVASVGALADQSRAALAQSARANPYYEGWLDGCDDLHQRLQKDWG